MPSPVAFQRSTMIERLRAETFDVLVVGGGITGAGVALDAATRGLSVALVDKGDLASGTSSKSSKLVHGGLRYLQQGDIALVYEGLAERQRLRSIAPHLVKPLPFLIPILSRDGVVNPKLARALGTSMWMYDLTGGVRIGKLHQRLTHDETLTHFPTLPPDRVAAGYLYYDARADDARLCLTVARTAAAHGAIVVNYAPVIALRKSTDGQAAGATVRVDAAEIEVRARAVVNAAGVWSDDVRALDEGADPDSIRPAKGIHITIPWDKVRCDIAAVIPVPKDKRSLFVVPWGDLAYVGTTDTDYDGPLDDPQCTPDDVAYVLRALNAAVTSTITDDDVAGTWAGLRPLVKTATIGRTADLSRRHQVTASATGLVTVTGGKLTTYRRMAADAVDVVMKRLGQKGRSRTKRVKLLGAEGYDPTDDGHLAGRYGSEAREIDALVRADAALARPLVPGLPYLKAEAVHAARHEMVVTLDDVLSRRTRARLLARDASVEAAPEVADLVGEVLGWDGAARAAQVAAYRSSVEHEAASLSAHIPEPIV
jgi:glycerol-3-phosphate dehydrogenase